MFANFVNDIHNTDQILWLLYSPSIGHWWIFWSSIICPDSSSHISSTFRFQSLIFAISETSFASFPMVNGLRSHGEQFYMVNGLRSLTSACLVEVWAHVTCIYNNKTENFNFVLFFNRTQLAKTTSVRAKRIFKHEILYFMRFSSLEWSSKLSPSK